MVLREPLAKINKENDMAIKTLGKKYKSEAEAIRVLQSELSKLEEKRQERVSALKNLPNQAGLSSVDELIEELALHAGPALRRKVLGRSAAKKKAAKKKTARKKTGAKKAARKKTARKKKATAKKKSAARKTAVKSAPAGKRTRARLTPEKVDEMKQAFDAKLTGKQVAEKFGVSESTVHNVKKRLGLTNV